MSLSKISSNHYYLGNDRQIHKDRKGIKDNIARQLGQLFSTRTYDPLKVIKAAPEGKAQALGEEGYLEQHERVAIGKGISSKQFTILNQGDNTAIALLAYKRLNKKFKKYAKALPTNSPYKQRALDLIEKQKILSKWNELKIDISAEDHYEEARWLVQSKVIYSILSAQNTTTAGKVNHEFKKTPEGLAIKKQGKWVPVKELAKTLTWDPTKDRLVGTDGQEWNYFSPDGLVPISKFYYSNEPLSTPTIESIEQLSPEEMTNLLQAAQTFYPTNEESAKNSHKGCVMQIVTHPDQIFPKNSLFDNANKYYWYHVSIRIITEDGKVYSTGAMDPKYERVQRQGNFNRLKTTNAQMVNGDYLDLNAHKGRLITNIPIDSEHAKAVLEQLNLSREKGYRFNIFGQNCAKMGGEALRTADVADIDLTINAKELLLKALPDPGKIAIVKDVYNPVVKPVRTRRKRIVEKIRSYYPIFLKKSIAVTRKTIRFLPEKVVNVAINIFLVAIGRADKGTPTGPHIKEIKQHPEGKRIRVFKNLLEDGKLFFSDAPSNINHSSKIIDWQLRQGSTVMVDYSGQPSLNILPPAKPNQAALKKLQSIYGIE